MKFALLTIFFLFVFNDGRAGEEKSDKKKRASVETASIEQLHWLTGDW